MTARAEFDRRRLLADAAAVAGFSMLLALGGAARAFSPKIAPEIEAWARDLADACADVRAERLGVADWRAVLDALADRVALSDLLAAIDFTALRAKAPFAGKGVATAPLRLPGVDYGALALVTKMFAIGPGRAIIPHGHDNMISAHFLLGGDLRLRQYDQVSRDAKALIVRPTIDRAMAAGEVSSISTRDDNVHWMTSEKGAWTLDVILLGLDPEAPQSFDIFNVDMDAAEDVGGGLRRATILAVAEALEKYG